MHQQAKLLQTRNYRLVLGKVRNGVVLKPVIDIVHVHIAAAVVEVL